MSSAAWKRLQVSRLKKGGLALAVAFVAFAGIRLAMNVDYGPRLLSGAGKALPVRHIDASSDGVLNREWIIDHLELESIEGNLLKIDVGVLKRRLEDIPQIRRAHVEKRFPDTLVVSIEERQPIARITLQSSKGELLRFLVDIEGVVYDGSRYDPKLVSMLPFLDIQGRLKRENGKFVKVEGVDEVGKLLNEAKTIAPHIYRTWKVVSLKDSPNIIVKSRNVKEARFEPKDYRRQLAKLDYIIDYNRSRMLRRVSKVDLTLGSQVPVQASVFNQ